MPKQLPDHTELAGMADSMEEVLEVSVETEHQLEEEMEVLGLSPQLLEQQHITPVVVVAGVTTLYQVPVEVLEA